MGRAPLRRPHQSPVPMGLPLDLSRALRPCWPQQVPEAVRLAANAGLGEDGQGGRYEELWVKEVQRAGMGRYGDAGS